MKFFNFNKIPEHEKTANNIVYNLIDDYSLEQQNQIIKIITTKIINHRNNLIDTNTFSQEELKKILHWVLGGKM